MNEKELIDKLNIQNQRLNELKKENEELKVTISKMEIANDYLYKINDAQQERIFDLTDELKNEIAINDDSITVKDYKAQIKNLEKDKKQIIFESELKIKELEKQIEKMKICHNCKFFYEDLKSSQGCIFPDPCKNRNKWELVEW